MTDALATFQHGRLERRAIAELVDRVFVVLLGCDEGDYAIDGRLTTCLEHYIAQIDPIRTAPWIVVVSKR